MKRLFHHAMPFFTWQHELLPRFFRLQSGTVSQVHGSYSTIIFCMNVYVCKCSNEIHVYILSTVISMIYIYIYNYVCIHNYIYLHILYICTYLYIYCKTELGIVKLSYEHLGGKQQKLAAHLKTSSLPTPATQKNLPLWIWFCYWNSIAAMVFRKPQQSVVSERNKT